MIDTNMIYEMVNRNLLIFPSVIKRIIGDRNFVMVHGNCQTQVIISMLGGSKEFAKKYDEIVKNIKRPDYYEKEEIINRIEKELENLKFKEENIDIKMWDYLNENYSKDVLFATSNHPIKEVMKEFTRRILKSLNIEDLEISCSDDEIQEPMPKEWKYLVYPCVLKNLGIKRDIEYSFRAFLTEEEKKIIEGINKAEIVQEQHCGALTYYEIKCDFDTYMRIYVRCLRASLSLL